MTIREVAETDIKGEPNIAFPLSANDFGIISDLNGHHMLEIRGWGRLIEHPDATQLDGAFTEWVVKTLNDAYQAQKDL
jgi:hypothetical protein